ncbi:MAG: type II toxin-antitoxin system PemK/MazF family toxin [Actinomycetota bacterium]
MKRGEIWLVDLDPTQGSEMKKTRPGIIVNQDSVGVLPLRVVVPITGWDEKYAGAPWLVRLEPDGRNGLTKASAADVLQIRSLSTRTRLVKRLGALGADDLEQVIRAIVEMITE